jgi:hypothetical protein
MRHYVTPHTHMPKTAFLWDLKRGMDMYMAGGGKATAPCAYEKKPYKEEGTLRESVYTFVGLPMNG